jgi:2-polyprenyl-6-methoxyphenol hydroxylase-like FAD-dependent oxidoreductase
MTANEDVGIVGFGPAGGALAVTLARTGRRATLFEQAPQLGPVGAGILLQPSGQAVLDRLGLLQPVVDASEPIEMLHAVHGNGRTLIRLRYDGAGPGCRAYGVHRGLLFEVLRRAVEAAGVNVCVGTPIESRRETADGVVAIDAAGREHGPFAWLAICDGSRSRLRKLVDPTVRERPYEYGALFANGPCEAVRGQLHQTVDGTRKLCGLLPTGGGRATLFWGLRCDAFETLRRSDFAAFRDEVVALGPAAEEIFAEFRSFEQALLATYRHAAPRRRFTLRTVLVGDAAHSMSPHLGQGANLALVDAECLAESLENATDPAAAFACYANLRRRQVSYYANLSRLLTPFFQSAGCVRGWGRNLALPLMTRIPPLRREMERSLAGIKAGWFHF